VTALSTLIDRGYLSAPGGSTSGSMAHPALNCSNSVAHFLLLTPPDTFSCYFRFMTMSSEISSPKRMPLSNPKSLDDDLSHLAGPGHGNGKAFLVSLRRDPTLAPLLEPHFDAASFSAHVVGTDNASGATGSPLRTASSTRPSSARSRVEVMVAQLTEQLTIVEAAIEKHILQHQQELMQGMGDLGELRENCDVLTVRSKELRRSVKKLSAELLEPYKDTERRTQQLRRIHESNDILKKIARFLVALTRIKESSTLSNVDLAKEDPESARKGLELRDIAKAAQHLHEVEAILEDPALAELSLVTAERPYVASLGLGLRRTGMASLKAAMLSMNQADLDPALQVFHNLQHLAPVVLKCLAAMVAEGAEATRLALDPGALEAVVAPDSSVPRLSSTAPTSSPPASTATSQRQGGGEMEAIALRQRQVRIRDHCDRWATVLLQSSLKVWSLQRALHMKTDAATNQDLLSIVLQSSDFARAADRVMALPSVASSSAAKGRTGSSENNTHIESAGVRDRARGWAPSGVGALYWLYWLELTAIIRSTTERASRRASSVVAAPSSVAAAPIVNSYPHFLRSLTDALDSLVDSTSKQCHSLLQGAPHGVLSRSQERGNPAALLALVEALGEGTSSEAQTGLIEGEEEHGPMSERLSPSSLSLAPETAGDSHEERTVGAEALRSLRDLYLGQSLQRLCRPIEQMFPCQEGYQAAIPSKHDLQALLRVMQTEVVSALAEGGPLLLPHVLQGMVKAVYLFCAKIEAMVNTGEGARKLYPLRGWMLGSEKEHNLQLLQLVALLHHGLQRLPQELAPAFRVGVSGTKAVAEAVGALETLAIVNLVHPYMVDIATELGGTLAEMHLENYAPLPQEQEQGDKGQTMNSRFISTFQAAVEALRKHHLNRFPLQCEFVSRAFKALAGRLLRLYVSHAALVRPLNEAGKAKITNDMAMLETALYSLHPKLAELGAPYLELKAFRELCFFGDEQNPLTVKGLLKERFTANLRPSTLLDALFARAPLELSSPHVLQRCSARTLVEELLSIYYMDKRVFQEGGAAEDEASMENLPSKRRDPRMAAESAHWQMVQLCLDAYAQRTSATQGELAYIYDVMLNSGGPLLKAFGDRLGEEEQSAAKHYNNGSSTSISATRFPLNW